VKSPRKNCLDCWRYCHGYWHTLAGISHFSPVRTALQRTRAVAGFIAAILIIFGLVFRIRHKKQPEKKDKNFVRIPVIGVVVALAGMLPGF